MQKQRVSTWLLVQVELRKASKARPLFTAGRVGCKWYAMAVGSDGFLMQHVKESTSTVLWSFRISYFVVGMEGYMLKPCVVFCTQCVVSYTATSTSQKLAVITTSFHSTSLVLTACEWEGSSHTMLTTLHDLL